MLIMRLLAAASVTDDRVNFTRRASPQNNLGAARGPIRFELVQRSAITPSPLGSQTDPRKTAKPFTLKAF